MNILIVLLLLLIDILNTEASSVHKGYKIPEDGRLNFTELAFKYGQHCEEHTIITEDGYILTMFRIVGDATRPVLLNHGVLDTADGFIIRGNTSLAITLARRRYDVWAMNSRGSRYARSHVTLDPDKDRSYWYYSGHEFGYYDVPAAIDYILKATRQKNLTAIGYSEGTFTFYVMGATRPEYNDKIKILISLAPIYFLQNLRPLASVLATYLSDINRALIKSQIEELFGFTTLLKSLGDVLCTLDAGYDLCLVSLLFPLTGSDTEEVEREFFPVIVGHYPGGSSRQNFNHFSQIMQNKRVAMYDYGTEGNLAAYKSTLPPEYDLSKITMRVALFVARNDVVSTIQDAVLLSNSLPNVVKFKILEPPNFNHVDFVWGRNTYKHLYPDILKLMEQYP